MTTIMTTGQLRGGDDGGNGNNDGSAAAGQRWRNIGRRCTSFQSWDRRPASSSSPISPPSPLPPRSFLGGAVGLWAFDAAGSGAAMQEKAGRMPNRLHTDANPGSAFSKF